MNRRSVLAAVALVGILYFALTRLAIRYFGAWTLEEELVRTTLRLASAGCFWYLMKPTILSKTPHLRRILSPWFIAGVSLFVLTPVLVGNYRHSAGMAFVIALHALYDAVFAFTPLLSGPVGANWGFVALVPACLLIGYWALSHESADHGVRRH